MVQLGNLVQVVGMCVKALERSGAITSTESEDMINKLKE